MVIRFLQILAVLVIGAVVVGIVEFFVGASYPSMLGRLFLYTTLIVYGVVIARVGQRHESEKQDEEEKKRKEKNRNLWD